MSAALSPARQAATALQLVAQFRASPLAHRIAKAARASCTGRHNTITHRTHAPQHACPLHIKPEPPRMHTATAVAGGSIGSRSAADSASAGSAANGVLLPEASVIASTANSYVKHLVKLRTSARYRREQRRCLLVGSELIEEAAGDRQQLPVRVLMLPEGASGAPPRGACAAQRTVRLSEPVLRKVTGLDSVAGVQAVVELDTPPEPSLEDILNPNSKLNVTNNGRAEDTDADTSQQQQGRRERQGSQPLPLPRILVLDGIQDPGNLGTLVRSALAFGWSAAYLLPGCCDPLNDKAVRASRGAVLRLPAASGTLAQLAEAAAARQLLLLSADMEEGGADAAGEVAVPEPTRSAGGSSHQGELRDLLLSGGDGPGVAAEAGAAGQRLGGVCLVMGSEGRGLSEEARAICTRVSIPMEGQMESLNVGVAGGILMFMLSGPAPRLYRRLREVLTAGGSGSGSGASG